MSRLFLSVLAVVLLISGCGTSSKTAVHPETQQTKGFMEHFVSNVTFEVESGGQTVKYNGNSNGSALNYPPVIGDLDLSSISAGTDTMSDLSQLSTADWPSITVLLLNFDTSPFTLGVGSTNPPSKSLIPTYVSWMIDYEVALQQHVFSANGQQMLGQTFALSQVSKTQAMFGIGSFVILVDGLFTNGPYMYVIKSTTGQQVQAGMAESISQLKQEIAQTVEANYP